MSHTITPQPVSAESWVAVLLTLGRQLASAGHDSAAAYVYAAAAEFEDVK